MPRKAPRARTSELRPKAAENSPDAPAKTGRAAREARLAEALRDNLKRRKARPADEDRKDR